MNQLICLFKYLHTYNSSFAKQTQFNKNMNTKVFTFKINGRADISVVFVAVIIFGIEAEKSLYVSPTGNEMVN